MKTNPFLLLASVILLSCSQSEEHLTESGLDPNAFLSVTQQGDSTALFVLNNNNGMEVCVTNFGARIVSVLVPDRDGIMRDVVLGFDNIKDYQNVKSDFGASIGRYANRINQGNITIDGEIIRTSDINPKTPSIRLTSLKLLCHNNNWQYKIA